MLAQFCSFIQQQQLPTTGTTLLALSGGVDSIVLSALFQRAHLRFAIVHCNFGLRGIASDQDEAFVKQLAQHYQVACYTQSFATTAYAQQKHISLQMAARTLRYQWFMELLATHALDRVATAHHWSDCIETILLNLVKGTGIAGLHGIRPQQGKCIRPLLFATKENIVQYAQEQQLTWREDCSNQNNDYQRNRLRNQVIPILKQINPHIEATCRITVEKLYQVETAWHEQIARLKEQLVQQDGPLYQLHLAPIAPKPWAALAIFEILKPFGFSFTAIQKLLASKPQSGKRILSTSYQLCINRTHWLITPRTQPTSAVYTITATTALLELPHAQLAMTRCPYVQYRMLPDPKRAALDLALLTFPLTIRTWQPGDVFFPLGMQQRKKVSDFLIDCKVPRPQKETIQVVMANHQLVWIIGYRIDDRFKLTATTQDVYEITLTPYPTPAKNSDKPA